MLPWIATAESFVTPPMQGKLPEAEVLWKEVLEVRRAQLGDRHTDTFKSINNLGLLLQKQGKLDEAEPLLRSALEARRATLPYRHPDTLASMNNLGRLLYDQVSSIDCHGLPWIAIDCIREQPRAGAAAVRPGPTRRG